ncbi:LamG domain-containing protein, partial [Winogradskyella vincentii]
MKTKIVFYSLLTMLMTFSLSAQRSPVDIVVKWSSTSFNGKVEIYNPANDLIATICDDNQCYTGTLDGVTDQYGSRYDLGCVTNGNNYYIKLYDFRGSGWASGYVSVNVAGTQVIYDTGSLANTSGHQINFNVSGGDASCTSQLDTDQDGLADYLDYDDDGDGISDGVENIGEDRFECTLPELAFENGVYDPAASSGPIDTVGAVYRFGNAIQGFDVLMEITEMTGAIISDIDDDTVDNPTYLQTEITFTGIGTPGVTFEFTIVNAGTTTPSTEIFRVNGITWDCDGGGSLKESVKYINPAAYGTENPTSLETSVIGSDVQISASGLQEGPGFSTLKVLRAYYQFIGNSFSMRMQAIKTSTGNRLRQFGMSFTQCEFLDFNADALVIISGEDFDGDGKFNHLDIDSDNDGIPDNVEAQTSIGYVIPSGTNDSKSGIDLVYGKGLTPIDSDGDKVPDNLDLDTDNDGLLDIEENGMASSIVVFSDSDNDGLDLLFEGGNINDPLDVNDEINSPESSILPDTDGDLYIGGDLDYRDDLDVYFESATIDFDGSDDYLSGDALIDGLGEITVMAWVKIDNTNNLNSTILGEGDALRFFTVDGNNVKLSMRTNTGVLLGFSGVDINFEEWHHVAATFNNVTGTYSFYIDGELKNEQTNSSLIGNTLEPSGIWNGKFELGRRSMNYTNMHYFAGNIDEVRVFSKALIAEQLQQMVYQEIENNGGLVKGKVVPKPIEDTKTLQTVAWTDLLAYYPMTDIKNSTTLDYSDNNRSLTLKNINTLQDQTAPMPYETVADGDWSSESTWLYG